MTIFTKSEARQIHRSLSLGARPVDLAQQFGVSQPLILSQYDRFEKRKAQDNANRIGRQEASALREASQIGYADTIEPKREIGVSASGMRYTSRTVWIESYRGLMKSRISLAFVSLVDGAEDYAEVE